MTRAEAIRKAKACLRLSKSANANEAAAALRQAQALMAQHGLDQAEVSDVTSADAPTKSRGSVPPSSIVTLAAVAGTGFGAQVICMRGFGKTIFRFYGKDGAAEVAAYAFTVLRRQMDADRLKHIVRVRIRANRDARGEAFALAWVHAVERLFPAAQVSEENRVAVDEVFKAKHSSAGTCAGRDLLKRGKSRDADMEAGYTAGCAARLHTGLKGQGAAAAAPQLPAPSLRCDRTVDMFGGAA